MISEANKAACWDFMERVFNQGDLSFIDEAVAVDAIDHQEPPGTDFRQHLHQVVAAMRTAFPDLHFEIHQMFAEGDTVAFRSTMTGTQLGPLNFIPGSSIPPTGRPVSIQHMHFVRMRDGQSTDLWHVWDTVGMLRQLGVLPQPQPQRG
ncbi:MAG TPA: ester cyclase [Aggregatilineaceae bacterium]|nr:ester cyclase [Aggregatilineaceae bacterium]